MREINMNDIYDIVTAEFKEVRQSSELRYDPEVLAKISVYSDLLSRICENVFDTPEQFMTYANIRKEQEDRSYFATLKDDPLKRILFEKSEAYSMIILLVSEKKEMLKNDNL